MKTPTRVFNFNLPEDLRNHLRMRAEHKNSTISQCIIDLITEDRDKYIVQIEGFKDLKKDLEYFHGIASLPIVFDETKVGGYLHFFLEGGKSKTKFIPVEMKDAFMKEFGTRLLDTNEKEVSKFIENFYKTK